jgi:hypothetical protein
MKKFRDYYVKCMMAINSKERTVLPLSREPISLAIHDDFIYVSNNTFNMGIDDCNGQILRAQLR